MAEPPSASGAVDTDTEVLGAARPVEPIKDQRAPLIGRTLGKFTIIERLGRGGSGEVFRAEQAQLGRSAVIKVLRSDLAPSPHRVERFLREARLASTLDHPYAAHIYAFGAEPDGLLWIAMEHVRGTTLDEVIARRGPMPPGVFAPLFERLCEVVHSAHELGIVHRDIKLANVMVIERSGQLLPKLLDFGIAKAHGSDVVSPGKDDDHAITGHGATIGSPPYMAPEQWQRPHDVDGRADIYALGVLAYRCLSGRPPIPGATRAELAHAHLHFDPKPLGVGPPALDEAIRRALAKSPDQRWPRALDFSAAVRKAVGAGTGEATPLLDGMVRDVWERAGPQPIAEAVARVAAATTTVECDDAVRDLVDVTCRWLAAIALAGCKGEHLLAVTSPPARSRSGTASGLNERPSSPGIEHGLDGPTPTPAPMPTSPAATPVPPGDRAETSGDHPPVRPTPSPFARPRDGSFPFIRPGTSPLPEAAVVVLRDRARDLAKHDDASAWLALARAACDVTPALPELTNVLAASGGLEALAARQARGRRGRTAGDLAADVAAISDALCPLDPLLAYRLVVGGEDGPETWVGVRQRNRPRALVWGDAVAVGEVVLLDGAGHIALRLSPLVRAQRPLPHGDLELFLIARTGRGVARLAATPWGFEHDDEEAGKFLAQLSTADSASVEEVDDESSPYPGLAAYGVDDADRFFGREREVDALANRLVRSPMVAVVGPSGVGKSSFVHAGLVARLREHYRVITLRPGRHPTEALHLAIEREATSASATTTARPAGGLVPSGRRFPVDDQELIDRLRGLGERAARGVVVIVDQLEEITTLCADAADRERFARVLGAAASTSTSPVRVVATLRDDFASLLESIDGFRDHYEVFVLGAPSPDALRRILLEPARRAGIGLEAGLVDDIIGEIAGRAAALPLLGFTAARLWQLRDRDARLLTRSAYQALGGVAGALATYADEVFARLGKREQMIARDVFARLVAADGTRVPMARAELAAIDGGSGVVDQLIDARLLTAHEDEPDPSEEESVDSSADLIEIVHECLAERWPRMVRWRSEDAADRALVSDLRAASRRWHDQHRPDDLLWRGAALNDLRRLAEKPSTLTAREREFAAASLAAARRRVRLRRAAVAAVLVAAIGVAGVMAYLMKVAGRNAEHAAESEQTARAAAVLAESRYTHQLRSAAQREVVEGRSSNALAYLGEVLRRGLDDDGIRLMIGQSSWSWPFERTSHPDRRIVAGTDDGTWFVVSRDRFALEMIDSAGQPISQIQMPSYTSNVIIEPGKERVLLISENAIELGPRRAPEQRKKILDITRADDVFVGCFGPADDEVTLWFGAGDLRTYGTDGALRRSLKTGLTMVNVFECQQDGSRALITTPDRTLFVDLRTMKPVIDSTTAHFVTASFANDGAFVLDGLDGKLEVHAPDGALRARWSSMTGPHVVWLSEDGKRIAAANDREITVYRPDGTVLQRMGGFRGGITAMRFVGDEIWTGGNDGMVRRWRRDGVQLAALMGMGGDVYDLQRTPTGVIAFSERGVRYWDGLPTQVESGVHGECAVDFSITARLRPLSAVVCSERRVELYDFDTGEAALIKDGRQGIGAAIDLHGTVLATFVWKGAVKLWNLDGSKRGEVEIPHELMYAAWVGDKLWIATYVEGDPEAGTLTGELLELDPTTMALRPLPWVVKSHVSMMIGLDDSSALVLTEPGALMLIRNGEVVKTVESGMPVGSLGPLVSVASGGKFVAVGGPEGAIKIFTLPDLIESHRIDAPGPALTSMSIDRDGTTLVTVSVDRRATAWSVETGEAITPLAVGEVPVFDAVFAGNPDELVMFVGQRLSRLKLPRATGTAAELAAAIACRVPLKPEGGALVPTHPVCPPAK